MKTYNVPRCAKHAALSHHNLNAEGGTAECGACIMREVALLYRERLDLLDTIADLLRRHAEIRKALSEAQHNLDYYQKNFTRIH